MRKTADIIHDVELNDIIHDIQLTSFMKNSHDIIHEKQITSSMITADIVHEK